MANEVDAVAAGSPEEASAAVARMLAVTEAAIERRAQLEHALQSRIAIEQAKGIIAERCGLDPDEAFRAIRIAARRHQLPMRDLIARVRPRQPTPFEIDDVLRGETFRRDADGK